MKTLIFGTSYVHGAAAAEVFRMWSIITRELNPGVDIVVVDSASPTPIYTGGLQASGSFECINLGDNIGHLSRAGMDGWGRAFMRGVNYGMQMEYDFIAHIECDLLFARPVAEVIAKMAANGVRAAAPMAMPYQFIETALCFFSVPYLRQVDLITRYDWEHPPANGLLPEQRIAAICEDALFALPLRGFRNDMGVSANQLPRMFPTGIDWITHAELPVLRKFTEMQDA